MYDLETLAVSFEIELYYNFKAGYQVVTDTLHMIDYVRGSIGLFFRNKG